jgi:hypothetical protein
MDHWVAQVLVDDRSLNVGDRFSRSKSIDDEGVEGVVARDGDMDDEVRPSGCHEDPDCFRQTGAQSRKSSMSARPFGYKIIQQDLGEGAPRRWRIIREELEPAEAEAIKEAATSSV